MATTQDQESGVSDEEEEVIEDKGDPTEGEMIPNQNPPRNNEVKVDELRVDTRCSKSETAEKTESRSPPLGTDLLLY